MSKLAGEKEGEKEGMGGREAERDVCIHSKDRHKIKVFFLEVYSRF